MGEKKAIFMNTASQVIVRTAGLFFTLISIKLLTNYFGPEGTGEFNTINTYISFFIVFADLGLFSVTVREIVKNPQNEKKIIANVFVLRVATALLAAVVASAVIFLTNYDRNIKIGTLIASGYILFNLIASIYDVIFQSRLKMQFSALAEFISKLVALLALYLIVRLNQGFLYATGTIALAGLVILLLKWFFARRFLSFAPKFDKKTAGWIFALAWPMGIVFILDNLYFKIDTLILFVAKGATEVGIYTVAYKVLEVTVFIGAYYANSLKPLISRNIESNKPHVANVISKSIIAMLAISMPITIVSVVFSREIIVFLSNGDFIAGYKALIILSFALPLIYLNVLLGEILVASDERKLLIKIAAFILSFNFLLNLLLIPYYSYLGAAVVTVLSEIVLISINLFYTRRIVPFTVNSSRVMTVLLASLLTFAAGYLLRQISVNFIILIIATFGVYGAFAYALGLFRFNMVQQVVSEK